MSSMVLCDLNKFIGSNGWAGGVVPLVYQCLLFLLLKKILLIFLRKNPGDTSEQSVIDRIKDELKAWSVFLQWYGMACLLVILIVVWSLL